LAKEFIKYKKSEKKLRESIRTIIKRLIWHIEKRTLGNDLKMIV
jgi:hypothetical protein